MNRRDFIKNCVIGLGALGLGLNVKGKPVQDSTHKEDNLGGYLMPQDFADAIQNGFLSKSSQEGFGAILIPCVECGVNIRIPTLLPEQSKYQYLIDQTKKTALCRGCKKNTPETLMGLPVQWSKAEISHDSVSWTDISDEMAPIKFREFRLVY